MYSLKEKSQDSSFHIQDTLKQKRKSDQQVLINSWTDPIVRDCRWWCGAQLFYMQSFILSLLPRHVFRFFHLSVNQMWFHVGAPLLPICVFSSFVWTKGKWKCYILSYVQLFVTLWTVACQVPLCPWDSPGKNTGVGCHFLLQGIFLIQGLNPRLLHWQVDSLPRSHQLIAWINWPSTPVLLLECCTSSFT